MSKKNRATDEELLAQLDDLSKEQSSPAKKGTGPAPTQPVPPASTGSQGDVLEELGLPERPKSSGRHTPRSGAASKASLSNDGGARSSDERQRGTQRKSGESARSFHNSFTPNTTEDDGEPVDVVPEALRQAASGGGSWWSTITSTASAAVKQAEALAKEIQQNEEAQKWAEQVRGNVTQLRGIGGELRSRALPTFTNILHTLAPPISSHERLQIHITHDFVGYPSLDPIIYSTFSRVMSQVEGGELLVIQRGQEAAQRREGSDVGGFLGGGSSGWNDGPWWRQATKARNLGAVKGLTEGTKLSRVSAESYATDFFSSRGGVEEAAKQATEVLSESNPVRSSDIFLSIQAISQAESKDLFGSSASEQQQEKEGNVVTPKPEEIDMICFAIYLHDPIHGITFCNVTQSLPEQWITWLDASASPDLTESNLPEDIAGIVNSGGLDPREWVAEWIEEALTLGVGVVAQRYVARRMGVGQGGLGKGKAPQAALDSNGGEAARAV